MLMVGRRALRQLHIWHIDTERRRRSAVPLDSIYPPRVGVSKKEGSCCSALLRGLLCSRAPERVLYKDTISYSKCLFFKNGDDGAIHEIEDNSTTKLLFSFVEIQCFPQ